MASAGLETPDMIELRKRKQQIEAEIEGTGEAPTLYKILPEKTASVGGAMMGSSKVYDLGSAKKVSGYGEVEMTLNPDELDLDSDALQSRYNQQLRQQGQEGEDLSDMMADHLTKQKKKQQQQQKQKQQTTSGTTSTSDKDKKKQKEFKF